VYDPDLKLEAIFNNLYEDTGEVSSVFVSQRSKQAQAIIRGLVGKSRN
jgi:hypothetical protein